MRGRWLVMKYAQTLLTAICGISLVLSWFLTQAWLPYVAVVAGAPFALAAGWEALKNRELDVNVLMILAATGAILLGHPAEAAVLLFLFSLSNTLEAYALGRTKSAIEGLMKLRPSQAILVRDGQDVSVPVEDLKVGDVVRVLGFEQIPVDGVVESGATSVDEAAMTGESVPVPKAVGDRVLSGTQNLDGMITLSVTAAVGDTTLEKIVSLVQDAQENKASGERISAWFGQRYTLFVIFATIASTAIRLLVGQPSNEALYASLTLLVALSPCAIVISSPATTLSALSWAARNGMLVRGGEFIESSGRVQYIAMDKTGTLTQGKPVLYEICVCDQAPVAVGSGGGLCVSEEACWSRGETLSEDARMVLRAAAAGEQYSTHPIAAAIVNAAVENGIEVPEATEQKSHSGLGVSAMIDGHPLRIGQRRFFEQGDERLPADFAVHAEELQRKGMTVAIMEYQGKFSALGLQDGPRPEAMAVLDELRGPLGLEIAMLTGDTIQTAEAVAADLKITNVKAGLMPADKERIIGEIVDSGRSLMMVGDGINDAPSLARATTGVAMGGLGSDIALNAADVVLMQDRLDRLPQLIKLGRKTNRVIRGNLIFAGGVIAVLSIGSLLFGLLWPDKQNLALPLAVIGHEGSTVLVILNGLRLLHGPGR